MLIHLDPVRFPIIHVIQSSRFEIPYPEQRREIPNALLALRRFRLGEDGFGVRFLLEANDLRPFAQMLQILILNFLAAQVGDEPRGFR